MELSSNDVEHIAELAKIGMTPEEIEVMRGQLSDILVRFRALSEINTDAVDTTAHPSGVTTALRTDKVNDPQSRETTMSTVPHQENEFVRVKAVLE